MKRSLRFRIAITTILLLTIPGSMVAAESNRPRLVLSADSGWIFLLGDPSGAEAPSFADRTWRTVDLPHDWSIEGRPDKDNLTGAGEGQRNQVGDETRAVSVLHHCVARDSAGQVAHRLWGLDHPYETLWPERLEIQFDIYLNLHKHILSHYKNQSVQVVFVLLYCSFL